MTRLYKRIFGFIAPAAAIVTLSACYQPANYAGVRYGSGVAYANEPDYYATTPVASLQDAAYTPVYGTDLAPITHSGKGATDVIVRRGDTVYGIARAYGASPKEIIRHNGLRYPYDISPGQRLHIPASAYNGNAPGPKPAVAAATTHYTVKRGDTLYRIAKHRGTTAAAIARMNDISTYTELHPGDRLRVPARKVRHVAKKKTNRTYKPKSYARGYDKNCQCVPPGVTPQAVLKPSGHYGNSYAHGHQYNGSGAPQTGGILGTLGRIIKREPVQPISYNESSNTTRPAVIRKPYTANEKTAYVTPATHTPAVSRPVTSSDGHKFILPVKGPVITNYGARAGGLFNEGVNISAARNTPVRASADGTVVYSGNAIRGYGNLVLVQHESGYITTYAHNERNAVDKGETVRKGQVIAYVGDSGQVTGTQLHFGIRKGRQSINPNQFLTEL